MNHMKNKKDIEKMAKGIARKEFFSQDGNTLAKYFGANHTHESKKKKGDHRRNSKNIDSEDY